MPACSVFKETNHRMVEQRRMRGTYVREEEDRNESRKKRWETKGQTPPTRLAFSLFCLQLSVDQSSAL